MEAFYPALPDELPTQTEEDDLARLDVASMTAYDTQCDEALMPPHRSIIDKEEELADAQGSQEWPIDLTAAMTTVQPDETLPPKKRRSRKGRPNGVQATTWLFTYQLEDEGLLDTDDWPINYCVYQLECAPTTGQLHYQGYVEFKRSVRLAAVKDVLPGAHWEPRKGTRDQARNYCMKRETRIDGPWEDGEWTEVSKGRRTDLEVFADKIKAGATDSELAMESSCTFLRYFRGAQQMRNAIAIPRNCDKQLLEVYIGPPGCGKTYRAFTRNKDIYIKPYGEWFDGYRGTQPVLIDDFYGDMPWSQLLTITDKYPCRVPIKGSFSNFNPSKIIITSNSFPTAWYSRLIQLGKIDINAFLRRVDRWVYWERITNPETFEEGFNENDFPGGVAGYNLMLAYADNSAPQWVEPVPQYRS